MLAIVMVARSVCLSVTVVHTAKASGMSGWNEMPICRDSCEALTLRNIVLNGGSSLPAGDKQIGSWYPSQKLHCELRPNCLESVERLL